MMLLARILIVSALASALSVAQAAGLTIEITKGSQTAVPIAVVPFGQQGSIGNVKLSDVVYLRRPLGVRLSWVISPLQN